MKEQSIQKINQLQDQMIELGGSFDSMTQKLLVMVHSEEPLHQDDYLSLVDDMTQEVALMMHKIESEDAYQDWLGVQESAREAYRESRRLA